MNEPQREMPRYKCHKEVHALKIKSVFWEVSEKASQYVMSFEEEGYAPHEVPETWFNKHRPHEGGYYVVYANGFTSFSPAEAFEDGYTRIES